MDYNTTAAFTLTADTGYSIYSATGCGGTLSGNTYTTGPVTGDCSISATFQASDYNVTGKTSTSTGGKVSCTSPVSYQGQAVCVITAPDGYSLSALTDNGANVLNSVSGGLYTINNIAADHNIAASFVINTYTVTPSAGVGGSIAPNTQQTVNYGDATTFLLTPAAGYSIVSVSDTCGSNGASSGTRAGNVYATGAIAANCAVTATFALNNYSITVSDTSNAATTQTANAGNTKVLTITPDAGYHVAAISGCGNSWTAPVPYSSGAISFTTGTITSDCTVSVFYEADSYVVTTAAGANGSISPEVSQTVSYGTVLQFTVTSGAGYTALIGGTCGGTLEGATFTTNAITADCTVSAAFALNTYTVTPSASAGGSISPSGVQTVSSGSKTTFTVTPAIGYSIASVTGCGGALSGNTYTTSAITGNCTVTATFKKKNYQVTPSAGTGGSISPSSEQTVTYGSNTTFTVKPDSGYTISSVGGSCGGTLSGSTYTTNAITSNCTVIATFTAAPVQNTCAYDIAPASQSFDTTGGRGTVSVTKSSTNCVWLATSNDAWITITAGSIGDTSSKVDFTVAKNIGTARTGTLTIAGQTFTVTQSGIQHTLTLTKSGTGVGRGLINNSSNELLCGADCQVAVLKYDAGKAITLSVTPEAGTTFNGWSGGGCAGTGTCTVTLNEDISVNAVFSSATAPKTDSSTSTVGTSGNDIYINVPVIKYTDSTNLTTYYSMEFVYVPANDNNIWLKLTKGNVLTDISPYSGVQMSEMYYSGSDLRLHLNNITINGAYIWADLKNVQKKDGETWFMFTGYGSNIQNTCTYGISPESQAIDSAGGTGSVSITASSGDCVWTASSNAAWITVTSGNSGSGNGTLTFKAEANTGAARTGSLTISGRTFTVTQAGIQHTLTLTKSGTGAGKGLIHNSGSELLCGADCEFAVLQYEAGSTITLSATPEAGMTFKGWSGGGCSDTGLCTVTLNEDTSINAVFSAATAASTDSSTSTIGTSGNDVLINVPVIKYTGSTGSETYFSTAFVYVPTDDNKIWVKLVSLNAITDISPYSGTQMSELYYSGNGLMLHLNNITINGAYLWADLRYMPTNDGQYWFVVTAAGAN